MKNEAEPQATVFLDDEEVWKGAWWKVWRRVLNLAADNREKGATITVVLEGKGDATCESIGVSGPSGGGGGTSASPPQ